MNTPVEFGGLESSALAALVFELAAQLHVERTARLALQSVLLAKGLVTDREIEIIAEDIHFKHRASGTADRAVRRLLRTLLESSDERAPLRAESPRYSAGEPA